MADLYYDVLYLERKIRGYRLFGPEKPTQMDLQRLSSKLRRIALSVVIQDVQCRSVLSDERYSEEDKRRAQEHLNYLEKYTKNVIIPLNRVRELMYLQVFGHF